MLLTPTGRCTSKYFSGVFIVGVQNKSFGHGQSTFVRIESNERCFAAVIHFCAVVTGKFGRAEKEFGRKPTRKKEMISTEIIMNV